jgi:hypothetical protein
VSYFDHVRCHSCRAAVSPDALGGNREGGLVCPRCGVALNLQDLFGVADAFSEEEEGPVSLDDLVRGPPPRRPSAPPGREEPPAEPGSALEAMRALKRR